MGGYSGTHALAGSGAAAVTPLISIRIVAVLLRADDADGGVTLVRNGGSVALALMLAVTTGDEVFTVRFISAPVAGRTSLGATGDERYGVQRGEIARQAHFCSYTWR